MFTVRPFNPDQDLENYAEWMNYVTKQNHEHDEYSRLISDLGYVVENDTQKLVMGFLYTSNSPIALMEFLVANPKAHRKDRKIAIKKLLTHIETIAISKGYEVLITITKTVGFGDTLIKNGFTRTVKSYEYFKVI
jgi:hypothetical protein